MIYLTTENNIVMSTHFMPFDEQFGLGKTKEELLQSGFLVDSLPEKIDVEGKESILKYDGREFFYDYIDNPIIFEKSATERIADLENAMIELATMLAGGNL